MSSASELSAHAGYLLRMVSNAVSQGFARKVASEGVTVAEWVMMRCLFGETLSPSALARKMGMTKGAISKLADRLLQKGLIERAGNLDDKRGHSLSLTAAALEKVPVLARIADEHDLSFLAVLTSEEQMHLRQLLLTLIDKHSLSAMPVD